jgi:hypothetical protein
MLAVFLLPGWEFKYNSFQTSGERKITQNSPAKSYDSEFVCRMPGVDAMLRQPVSTYLRCIQTS